MKKTILLSFAITALGLASCKKDRTCTCTTTTTYTMLGQTSSESSTDVTTMTKVSKGTAKANCQSMKMTYTDSYLGTPYTYNSQSTCTLK